MNETEQELYERVEKELIAKGCYSCVTIALTCIEEARKEFLSDLYEFSEANEKEPVGEFLERVSLTTLI